MQLGRHIVGVTLCALVSGCAQTGPNGHPINVWGQQPAVLGQQASNTWTQTTQPYLTQLQELNQQTAELNTNNRDLHAEIAKLVQQASVKDQELDLLRQRLTETADQLRAVQVAANEKAQQLQDLTAAATRGGGASITANNSLQNALRPITLTGLEVRPDGDVIRIELPSDRLFQQGSAQLLATAYPLLDQVADAVVRSYPDQMIGVEGHSDGAFAGASTNHRLSLLQALAVLETLAQRNRIPDNRLQAAAYGANYPRSDSSTVAGRAANRRVEIVIYPETVRR